MLRPKLNRIWTSTNANLRRDPGDAKYIQGWISEIPTYQVLNYLQYKVDTTLLALAERGIFEWGSDVTYGLASVVWDETDKRIYVSTVGAPDKTKAPSANSAHWTPSSIQVSRASYDSIVAAINAHIADVTGNPHKLTAGRLNAYNKNETDAIVAQYRALVLAHSSDKNNPHGVTATQTGAVPSTGGTYSGDVIFNAGVFFDSGKVNKINKSGGLFLQNGAGQIGINDSGVGMVGPTNSMSKIVTEASYPGPKSAQEPNYAVPTPNFQMNCVRDINIQTGSGYVDSNFDPIFSAANGSLEITTQEVNQTVTGSETLGSSQEWTISFDILAVTPKIPTDVKPTIIIGMNDVYIYLTGSSLIRAERRTGPTYESAQYQLTGPINTWYKVSATFKGNNITLFVNGVQVAQVTNASGASTVGGGPFSIVGRNKSADAIRTLDVRNIRLWAQALTNKQVSNL